MKQYIKDFLNEQKEKRPTYKDMIDFCCDSMILNNYIIQETEKSGYYWEMESGSDCYYTDANGDYITEEEYYQKEEAGEDVYQGYEEIYQYFIIGSQDAERLEIYTNEIIFYCEALDLYILGVTHWGTAWGGVPANWKEPEEENEEEAEAQSND